MKHLLLSISLILPLMGCNISTLEADTEETVYGDIMLYWTEPTERANGDPLSSDEIGGYEIRYKQASEDSYSSYIVSGNEVTQLLLENIPNPASQTIEVAVFDTDGIYSDYVEATTD